MMRLINHYIEKLETNLHVTVIRNKSLIIRLFKALIMILTNVLFLSDLEE
jgi:hypothetical protein